VMSETCLVAGMACLRCRRWQRRRTPGHREPAWGRDGRGQLLPHRRRHRGHGGPPLRRLLVRRVAQRPVRAGRPRWTPGLLTPLDALQARPFREGCADAPHAAFLLGALVHAVVRVPDSTLPDEW